MDPPDDAVESALALAGPRRATLEQPARAGDERALIELAEQRVAAGQGDAAVAILTSLVERRASAPGWAALARVFEAADLHEDALGCWEQAVSAGAGPGERLLLGDSYRRRGRLDAAEAAYLEAIARDPSLAAAHYNLGGLLVGRGRWEEAAQAYRAALSIRPDHARAWGNLGVVLRRMDRALEGIEALERAVAADPRYGRAWANLASALEEANAAQEARVAADRALLLAPGDPLARLISARLDRRDGALEAAEGSLLALMGEPLPPDLAARAAIELGFVRDRRGDAEGAFPAFQIGQRALAELPEARAIDRGAYPRLLAEVEATADALWSRERPERNGGQAPGDEDDGPVFVLGFPRSGTTLTEQVLASHPAFSTSDEAPLLEAALRGIPGYPRSLLDADDAALRGVRAAYLASLPRHTGRFVDKFPLNLVHLPALRLLFPRSPIVLVLRDPRDVVLSNYMQDFIPNEAMIHSMTLAGAAALYDRVMGLVRGWLPRAGITHTVRYEALVEDLEGEARRLLGALGEPWDPAVLRFHEQAAGRRISTPSHHDVARPIFRRASGRWRRYEGPLAAVLPLLGPHVEAFGYEA